MSRAAETLVNIPLTTLCIMSACCLVYSYQFLLDPAIHHYTMCPRLVIYMSEYYRFISSSLFHGSIMHIGMNMMSTMAIGSSLERRIGTLSMAITILWGVQLTSSLYTFISWLLYMTFGYEHLMLQHSVGFSGVIFQLAVLEANLSPDRTRSVFGFINVSSKIYPWALLVILQFIMPQISFLGHLSGILIGTMQFHGCLNIVFPSDEYLKESEQKPRLAFLVRQPGFVSMPEAGSGLGRRREGSASAGFFAEVGGPIALFVRNICETLKVIIFGRGSGSNQNIQMSSLGAAWGSDSVRDEEGWNGLPTIDEERERLT
jgi:membrane associated rhomboid family serine protease